MLKSFDDVHQALRQFMPTPKEYDKARFSLENMKKLLDFLGNPQDKFKTIHVAGTSGKTSTSYYIAALLKESGQKVGLTVSPHVDEVNERVQINLEPLKKTAFCKEFDKFLKIIESSNIKPSYFAVVVSFAYWLFAEQKVDYAVVEVGMGGLLDATNTTSRKDKVCVITDIDLDHTEYLGNTLAEIAAQKAGIINAHNTVFSYEQNEEIMSVLREVCSQQQAELHEVLPMKSSELPKNLPLFQRRNWYLALHAVEYVAARDKLNKLSEIELASSTQIYIPARMEVILRGKKTLIIDGAHNAQKLKTLAASIKARYPEQDIGLLLGLVQSKDRRTRSSVEAVIKFAKYIIITSFSGEQDTPKESVKPAKIAEHCHMMGYEDWEIVDDPVKAFKALLKRPEPILLITGSFFLLNQIRPVIFKKK